MDNTSFFKEIWTRFCTPWSLSSFRLYFFLVIVLFGGTGIWISIFQGGSITPVADNMMTYAITLAVPACISIILGYLPQAEHQVSLTIWVISLLIIEVVLIGLFLSAHKHIIWRLIIAILGIILSWFFWIIANSDNKYLDDNSYIQTIKKGTEKHGEGWN